MPGGDEQLGGGFVADPDSGQQVRGELLDQGMHGELQVGDLVVQLQVAPRERLQRDLRCGDRVAVPAQVRTPGGQGADQLHACAVA